MFCRSLALFNDHEHFIKAGLKTLLITIYKILTKRITQELTNICFNSPNLKPQGMMIMLVSTSKTRIAVIAVLATLTIVAGCAKKKIPNSAADIGINNVAPGSTQDFTVNVGDRVFFETDSSVLTAVARTTLDKQAQWLSRYPQYQIVVEGHADERGTREYNIALGARRAAATRNYLSARGVPANRMRTLSYGKEQYFLLVTKSSCCNCS